MYLTLSLPYLRILLLSFKRNLKTAHNTLQQGLHFYTLIWRLSKYMQFCQLITSIVSLNLSLYLQAFWRSDCENDERRLINRISCSTWQLHYFSCVAVCECFQAGYGIGKYGTIGNKLTHWKNHDGYHRQPYWPGITKCNLVDFQIYIVM